MGGLRRERDIPALFVWEAYSPLHTTRDAAKPLRLVSGGRSSLRAPSPLMPGSRPLALSLACGWSSSPPTRMGRPVAVCPTAAEQLAPPGVSPMCDTGRSSSAARMAADDPNKALGWGYINHSSAACAHACTLVRRPALVLAVPEPGSFSLRFWARTLNQRIV